VPALRAAPRSFADAHRYAQRRTVARADVAPLVQYRHDPVRFAVEVLGLEERAIRWSLHDAYRDHAWDGTPDPLAAIAEALARGEHVGVESGTGVGKTFTAGWLSLWFLSCWESRVFAVATREEQIELGVWQEITPLLPRWRLHFPDAVIGVMRIQMRPGRDDWAWHPLTAAVRAGEESATKAQGKHAEHMLFVVDEMPGVHSAVLNAITATLGADHNLLLGLGNPDHQLDPLHTWCERSSVTAIRVSSLDAPNVVTGESIMPGSTGRKLLAELLEDENGNAESPRYLSRVRGISPAQATDALVHREWIRAAMARGDAAVHDPKLAAALDGLPALGVDVANSEGGDFGAIARGKGAWCYSLVAFPCPDANALGDQVAAEALRDNVRPVHIGIDPIGVGAGAVNQLKRAFLNSGEMARQLNGAMRPQTRAARAPDGSSFEWVPESNRFKNLRSQMWWQLREDLRLQRIALPRDKALEQELLAVRWEPHNGTVVIDPKDNVKARLGRSPDRADAVVYWNWVRPRRKPEQAPDRNENRAPLFRAPSRTVETPFATYAPAVPSWNPLAEAA
jgi:phage terminase large subunit